MNFYCIYVSLLAIGLQDAKTTMHTEGTRFILYFTEGSRVTLPARPLHLYFTTRSSNEITVRATSPSYTDGVKVNETIRLTSSTPAVVPIAAALRTTEFGNETKVILVESTGLISVYGLNPSANQAALFTVLPVTALGTEYIFPSLTAFNIPSQGFMGIVTQEDQTSFEVFLSSSSQKSIASIRGIEYPPRSVIRATLNKYEVSEIRQIPNCPDCDLTGSRISASKPIAVFSTVALTNPVNDGGGGDLLVEQLVPLSLWGRSYITQSPPENSLVSVNIFASVCDAQNIYINKTKTPTWRALGTTGYVVANEKIPNTGFHLVDSGIEKLNVRFGGYVYGQGEASAYAAPLAMEGGSPVGNFPWADPDAVAVHQANLASTDRIQQQIWRLKEKNLLSVYKPLRESVVFSKFSCLDSCKKLPSCLYASIEKENNKIRCRLFDERSRCDPKMKKPGVRTYVSRITFWTQI
ncbi:uncharacterized protein LOC131935433 [Physella acuta]|uniref:uncharacterized protein LOC131935433 n=1 Tax=Physella acuta TaxID=109671 RepID=UPI0027DBAE2D|nr:uncharacterized protein LOC131935433 [Physella acuta]